MQYDRSMSFLTVVADSHGVLPHHAYHSSSCFFPSLFRAFRSVDEYVMEGRKGEAGHLVLGPVFFSFRERGFCFGEEEMAFFVFVFFSSFSLTGVCVSSFLLLFFVLVGFALGIRYETIY